MTEAVNAKNDEKKQESATLATIEPNKVEKGLIESVSADIEATDKIEIEKSLISATRLLLRHYGIRKSGAAVRDAIGTSHTIAGPKEAVNALSNLGFKASFGRLNIRKLRGFFSTYSLFKKW